MEIIDFIGELLDENDFVIIPGLGAFLATYQPARMDESGRKFLPPSRKVSFQSDIRVNDGLFVLYAAKQMKIPVGEAQERVLQWADELHFRLDKREVVDFGPLGSLQKKRGVLQFTPSRDAENLPGSWGLTPLLAEKPSDRDSGRAKPVFAAKREAIQKVRIPRKILFAGLALILVACCVWVLAFRHNRAGTPPESLAVIPDSSAVQPHQIPSPDTLKVLTTPASKPAEPGSADRAGSLYYLIGGSFLSEENAGKYILRMAKRGYHPFSLGQVGSFYLVALDTFTLRKDAIRAVYRLNNTQPGGDAWIYHPATSP